MIKPEHFLRRKVLLNSKYTIKEVLGVGPYTITYLAEHSVIDKDVVIKEFFIDGACKRNKNYVTYSPEFKNEFNENKQLFLSLAKTLAKNTHSDIIDVTDWFEENHTAYFVMPFINGVKLNEFVKQAPYNRLTEDRAAQIAENIAKALEGVHNYGALYKNLSPENIIVRGNEQITLIDFDFSVGFKFNKIITELKDTVEHEYRPLEQLTHDVSLTEACDVYSLSSTLYFMLSGKNPKSANKRLNNPDLKLPGTVSKAMKKFLQKGMSIDPSHRHQSMKEFLKELPQNVRGPQRMLRPLGLAAAILITAFTVVFFNKDDSNIKNMVTRGAQGNAEVPNEEAIAPYIEGDYFALLIGVQDYEDESLDLDKPLEDVNRVKDVLMTNYTFEEENISILENPTRSQIVDAVYGMRKSLTEKDNLLIFYAGHGHWDESAEQGYWMPADADHSSPSNWISNSSIKEGLRALTAAHILVVSDACFSGSIFKFRGDDSSNKAIDELSQLRSRKAMTSGNLTRVPDMSVFVDYFVTSLEKNNKQYLPSGSFFHGFRQNVINNSRMEDLVPQYGTIGDTGDEGGDFIFVRRK